MSMKPSCWQIVGVEWVGSFLPYKNQEDESILSEAHPLSRCQDLGY